MDPILSVGQKSTTPLPSLLATAKVRFLNADITAAFSKSTVLPSNIHDAKLKERRLKGPIAVQVMGVEDMKQSRWSQIEAIEAAERGEGMRGREVVRVVPGERGEDDEALGITTSSGGMCKLLLMDANGSRPGGWSSRTFRV